MALDKSHNEAIRNQFNPLLERLSFCCDPLADFLFGKKVISPAQFHQYNALPGDQRGRTRHLLQFLMVASKDAYLALLEFCEKETTSGLREMKDELEKEVAIIKGQRSPSSGVAETHSEGVQRDTQDTSPPADRGASLPEQSEENTLSLLPGKDGDNVDSSHAADSAVATAGYVTIATEEDTTSTGSDVDEQAEDEVKGDESTKQEPEPNHAREVENIGHTPADHGMAPTLLRPRKRKPSKDVQPPVPIPSQSNNDKTDSESNVSSIFNVTILFCIVILIYTLLAEHNSDFKFAPLEQLIDTSVDFFNKLLDWIKALGQ